MGAINKNIQIELQGQVIVLKKLSLGKLVKLLDHLSELPTEVMEIDKIPAEEMLQKLPVMVALSLPKFVNIIVKATDHEKVTADFLTEQCSLDEIMDLVYNLLVVNNVAGILTTIKKMQALKTTALTQ